MTSIGDELGEIVQMLKRLPAEVLGRLLLDFGLTVEWKFSVRAEHLLRGTCPVPPEMAARAAPQESLALTF